MGFLVLAIVIAVTAAFLWWAGKLKGAALQVTLAALMLGGAGYALMGRPDLPGTPRYDRTVKRVMPLTEPRQAMLGTFSAGQSFMIISDSYARRGDTEGALGAVQAGLKAYPNELVLKIGLANALVDHAGMITPAARLAFERARAAAPNHPAPYFFEGLALARAGEREAGLALFRRALALTPEGTSYRPMVVDAVEAVSRPLPRGPFQQPPAPSGSSPRP
jgi:tetratricopeptide (TPR) repeat protein